MTAAHYEHGVHDDHNAHKEHGGHSDHGFLRFMTVPMNMRVPIMTTVPTVTNAHNDHGMVPIMPMIKVPTRSSAMFDMLPTVNCA